MIKVTKENNLPLFIFGEEIKKYLLLKYGREALIGEPLEGLFADATGGIRLKGRIPLDIINENIGLQVKSTKSNVNEITWCRNVMIGSDTKHPQVVGDWVLDRVFRKTTLYMRRYNTDTFMYVGINLSDPDRVVVTLSELDLQIFDFGYYIWTTNTDKSIEAYHTVYDSKYWRFAHSGGKLSLLNYEQSILDNSITHEQWYID